MKINENQCNSMKINENQWKSIKIIENLRKSMQINANQLIPPPPPHPTPQGGGGQPLRRHALANLCAQVSGEKIEEDEVYCWDSAELEAKVLESFEAELMEEPYVTLEAEMQQNVEKSKKMKEQAAHNWEKPADNVKITLERLKKIATLQ